MTAVILLSWYKSRLKTVLGKMQLESKIPNQFLIPRSLLYINWCEEKKTK